jgi:hypothetical protein
MMGTAFQGQAALMQVLNEDTGHTALCCIAAQHAICWQQAICSSEDILPSSAICLRPWLESLCAGVVILTIAAG